MSLTIVRSSPTILLTSEDLPTFGRPITAIFNPSSSYSFSKESNSSTISSSKSPIFLVCSADIGTIL